MKLGSDGENKWDHPVTFGTEDNDKVSSAGIVLGDLAIASNSTDKNNYSTAYVNNITSDGTLLESENSENTKQTPETTKLTTNNQRCRLAGPSCLEERKGFWVERRVPRMEGRPGAQ